MRAAAGVVLRRDLSLSRRLFAWLLGNSEKPAAQVSYLKEHSLDLLVSTLKVSLDNTVSLYQLFTGKNSTTCML
jgi:hypothetical protein